MKRTPIHTVTVIPFHPNKNGERQPGDWSRCWGFETTRPAARKMLQRLDCESGYFTYAVIEKYQPGLYTLAESEEWYKWDKRKHCWVDAEKPRYFHPIINHALG